MMRFLLLLLFMALPVMASAEQAVANIGQDQITVPRATVVLMYSMRVRYWEDGTRVSVFNLPHSHSAHKIFVRNVLGMSPITYQQQVNRQINAGVGGNYHIVENLDAMLRRVSATYGAVGYVSNDYLLINQGGLRALRIVD
jgi:hypothetical protein